jgi:hypothetical protein
MASDGFVPIASRPPPTSQIGALALGCGATCSTAR